ncbi:hypothetical protein AMECASPLE_027851 [Ameca splendens]|uniref:Uncharacterized protein n=1 Tax=Ameca splendens TaxID=208324 RepID=A0ABV1ADA3_9TELE
MFSPILSEVSKGKRFWMSDTEKTGQLPTQIYTVARKQFLLRYFIVRTFSGLLQPVGGVQNITEVKLSESELRTLAHSLVSVGTTVTSEQREKSTKLFFSSFYP